MLNRIPRCLIAAILFGLSLPLTAQDTLLATSDAPAAKTTKKRSQAPVMQSLRGTISWEGDAQLEERAIVNVWLQEVAPLQVVAKIIARQVIKKPGEKPIAFRLKYDLKKVRPDGRYFLLVKIYEGDRTRFINVARYPVINDGCTDECEVIVNQMN